MRHSLCRLGGRGRRRPLPPSSHAPAPAAPLLLRPQQPPRAAQAWSYDGPGTAAAGVDIGCRRRLSSSSSTSTKAAAPAAPAASSKRPSPARQRQLLVEALLPAFKDADYGRVLALLNQPPSAAPADAKAAVAALTRAPALAPLSLALYKAAAGALASEGLEGEALMFLQGGFRQGHLSEAALRRGYDGVLWALRYALGDDGTRMLRVVDAVSKGRVRPTDGGYVPLLEALGERAGGPAVEEIYRVLTDRVGPDAALPMARKAVVFGLGLKYLVEAPGPAVDAGRLLALKEGMQQRWGVPLVEAHLGLLASALAGQGRVAACLALLREQGLDVSERVVNMALAGLLRYQQQQQQGQQQQEEEGDEGPVWEGAIRLLSLLFELGKRPTSHGVTATLLICGRAGHWPLALRVFDEGLWWGRVGNAEACDTATLNAAMEVLPPLDFDGGFNGHGEEEKEEEEEGCVLLRLFGPDIYRQGVAAGLSRGWERRARTQAQAQGRRRRPQQGSFIIDLHEHSLRMALYGALPDALRALQDRVHSSDNSSSNSGSNGERHLRATTTPFPFREVHIVTGHGTGRGRYRGRGPQHKPEGDVGVLFPRVLRWAERGVGSQGKVFEVSLGCVGVEGEALRRALPALLASVS